MYAKEVQIDEKAFAELRRVYKIAIDDISKELETATNFGVANRKQLLSQIKVILTDLGEEMQDITASDIESYYTTGARVAEAQLANIGVDVGVTIGLSNIQKQSVQALTDDIGQLFAESMSGVYRGVQREVAQAVRKTITQRMASNLIRGEALKTVKKDLVNNFKANGLTALIDKAGKQWALDTYSEMLYRTKVVEARNRGLADTMLMNDYDLVQVSNHNSSHDACAVWEGKILSLTGASKEYPTLDEARSAGLFHPNCKHAINTLIPSLAKKTSAYK